MERQERMRLNETVDRLIDFYQHLDASKLESLGDIYHDNIVFQDPAQRIAGLPALKAYFAGLMENVADCRFVILRSEVATTIGVIEWQMHFSHPRLHSGKPISMEGVSLLTGDDKIRHHRDHFDLGAMIYEHVPVVGGVIRHLKRRLQS